MHIQLQAIKLPCFNGNALDWQVLINISYDLIHTTFELSVIKKNSLLAFSIKGSSLPML